MANIFAKNSVDGGEVRVVQEPTGHFSNGGELFRMTCAPECDANTRLVEEPTGRQMNHAFPETFASEGIQFFCCCKKLAEMRLLKLGIAGLAHIVFRKLAIGIH